MWGLLTFFWEKLTFSSRKELILKNEISILNNKLKESEEKNKSLNKLNLELEEENKKMSSELEAQKSLKNYLQEKKMIVESYYGKFKPTFEGDCSFTKEVEIIFSLLDMFAKEFLEAYSSKEKIFRDDMIFADNFLSLSYPSINNIKTASKEVTIRITVIRIRFQGVVKGNYEKVPESGINKLFFLKNLLDEYIQMHVMEILGEYFAYPSFSHFKEKTFSQVTWLISLFEQQN